MDRINLLNSDTRALSKKGVNILFKLIAPLYVLGYFIILKQNNLQSLDNYILSGLGLFFILISYNYICCCLSKKKE